jgi:RND family efflux transporter MFP subunit
MTYPTEMFANKTKGGVLLKVGLVLVLLVGITIAVLSTLQRTARVKKAKRDTAVDAVTGSVFVNADGGTNKELKAESDGKVTECSNIVAAKSFKGGDVLLEMDTSELKRSIEEFRRKYFDDKKLAHIRLTGGKPELLANVEKLSDEERAKLYRDVSPIRKLTAEKLEQQRRLHALNSISDEDLRTAERALDDLDRQLMIDAFNERRGEADFEAALDTFKLQLDRMQIRAPDDGEITEALIWKGALIGRGTVVGKWMSHERVVNAKISEESFGKVKVGQKALVRLLTYGERSFVAEVSKLLPNADEVQRFTVFLDVKVDSPDQLKPGSTGEVTITVDERRNAVMIPRLALFDSDKVCVVKDGRVEKRRVKVGYINLTEAEILDGIAEGEHVILDQPQRFPDGQRVRVEVLP